MSEPICIRNCHLLIPLDILPEQFQEQKSILMAYDPEKKAIFISGPRHIGFKLSYSTAHQQIMKLRNLKGDRSIACHALFLDHSLADEPNQDLTLEVLQDGNILQINMPTHPILP